MNYINSKMDKLKTYLWYTLGFAVVVGALFAALYFTGMTAICKGEALTQYLPSQSYFMRIFGGFFKDLTGGIPTYNFNIGMGQDSLLSYESYGINDPITILTMLLKDYISIPTFYFVNMAIRLYFAGLAFIYITFYFEKNRTKRKKLRKFDHMAVCLGAWIYIFSSFGIGYAFKNPVVLNSMIILPLIVVSLHRLIYRGVVLNFILLNTVSVINNFQIAYTISIIGLIYALVELFYRHKVNGTKKTFKLILSGGICYIISILLSGVFLLPMAYGYLHSSKVEFTKEAYLIGRGGLEQLGFELFNSPSIYNSTMIGVFCIAFFTLVILLISKGNKKLKVLSIIGGAFLISPFLQNLATGFFYNDYIWNFSIILLLSYVFVSQHDRMFRIKGKKKAILICLSVIYLVLAQLYYIAYSANQGIDPGMVEFWLGEINLIFMLGAIYLVSKRVDYQKWFIFGLVSLGLCANVAGYTYSMVKAGDLISQKQYVEICENKQIEAVAKKTRDKFERVELAQEDTLNFGDLYDFPSNTVDLPMEERGLAEFNYDMKNAKANPVNRVEGFNSRAIIEDLLSVKYYINNEKNNLIPYGFSKLEGNLYINKNYIPFGFTYDTFVKPYDLTGSSELDRQEIMTKAVILEENPEGINYLGRNFVKDLSLKDTSVKAEQNGADVKLSLKYDGEVYLKLDNKKELEQIQTINIKSKGVTGEDRALKIDVKEQSHPMVINLGYFKKGEHIINIDALETRELDMKFECRNLDSLNADCVKLGKHHLTDIKVTKNGFSADIGLDKNKMLFISVPYERRSWIAYVDEINTKIYKANEGFMAVRLKAGVHHIEFKYTRPFQREGITLSWIGLAALIAYLVLRIKRTEEKEVI